MVDIDLIESKKSFTVMEQNDLLNLLEKYDVISFDIFDTLMFRTVNTPSHVCRLVMAVYNERHPKKTLHEYPFKRGYAEAKAREKKQCEVNIDEIYSFLDYPIEICKELQEIEEKCEIDNCVSNPVMTYVVRRCRENGKRVVITSDMYLPRKVIESILKKIDVNYDKLYLSCELRKTKKDGDLFRAVLDDQHILPSQMVHIGDNIHSDIEMPRRLGIASVERLVSVSRFDDFYLKNHQKNIVTEHLASLFQHNTPREHRDETEYRIGYTVLGPFLYSFCQWIHKMKLEHGISKLFFLARDGYLISKCYKRLYPQDDIEYICLNKNLLRLPTLSGGDISILIKSLPPRRYFSWKEMFAHLSINGENELGNRLGEDVEKAFPLEERLLDRDILDGKYDKQLSVLFDLQKEKIEEQTLLLNQYLLEKGFYGKRVGLVNNSMEGSAQSMLTEFVQNQGNKIDLIGLQFSASPSCQKRLGNRVKTYFNGVNELNRWAREFRFYPLPFEHLVFEPVGTARYFYLNNQGHVDVKKDTCSHEQKDYATKQAIRDYALSFVSDYSNNTAINIELVSKFLFMRLLLGPKNTDGKLIGDFWDEDVEGIRHINTLPHNYNGKPDFKTLLTLNGFPPGIVWAPGYVASINMPSWYRYLLRLKICLFSYIKRPDWMLSDFLLVMRRNVNVFLSHVYYILMKTKYRLMHYTDMFIKIKL